MKRISILILALVCGSAVDAQSSAVRPLKSRIKGIWAAAGEDNTTFVIRDSTIFYADHNGTYKYTWKGDSIRVKYEGFAGRFLINMFGNDTLVMKGDEETVYYRFDNAEKLLTIKDFYTRYITEMAIGVDPRKLDGLQKKYCTTRLIKSIPKLAEQTDADPLIKAQDADTASLKSLTVERDPKKEDQYVVTYTLDQKVVIHLAMGMTNSGYKIDAVW